MVLESGSPGWVVVRIRFTYIIAVVVFSVSLVILPEPSVYHSLYSSVNSIMRTISCSTVAVPGVYPLSTVRLEKGIGLRLNLLWVKPQEGEGRIPVYWEESRAGTGMALTTAETHGQNIQLEEKKVIADWNVSFWLFQLIKYPTEQGIW